MLSDNKMQFNVMVLQDKIETQEGSEKDQGKGRSALSESDQLKDMEQSIFENDYKMVPRGPDRRQRNERRTDPREQSGHKSVWAWIRSIFKPRVGVDRRKGSDRRQPRQPSESSPSATLTKEELDQLLD